MVNKKTNIRAENTLSDSYIILEIANALNKSISMIAKDLGEKTGTVYSITGGNNKLSPRLISKFTDRYPEINFLFITKGKGEPLRKDAELINQNNVLGKPNLPDLDFQKEIFTNLTLINKKLTFLQQDIDEIKRKIQMK